jgi:23S rRNA (cytidine2498-2'-O)-methyltransferase
MSAFFYIICQPGAEALVKADVQRRDSAAKPAFSRPGFLTFKVEQPLTPALPRPTPLARAWGLCLGAARGPDADREALALLQGAAAASAPLHAWTRDRAPLTVVGDPYAADPWEADAALRARLSSLVPPLRLGAAPRQGELVADLIEVDDDELWVGLHQHGPTHRATPGGRPPRALAPPEAPSRVWHKIEEALWWSELPLQPGDLVLDIGCAPGGGPWNLLRRGLRVLGVDPAQMGEHVLRDRAFSHRPEPFERLELTPKEVKEIQWVIFDVNLSPMLTLKPLVALLQKLPGLRGALITLKLNRPEHFERLDWMLDQLRRARLKIVDVNQLFFNRQEVCVHARRPR